MIHVNIFHYVTTPDGRLVVGDSSSINEVFEVLVFKKPVSDVIWKSSGKLWFLDNLMSSHSASFCRNVVGNKNFLRACSYYMFLVSGMAWQAEGILSFVYLKVLARLQRQNQSGEKSSDQARKQFLLL